MRNLLSCALTVTFALLAALAGAGEPARQERPAAQSRRELQRPVEYTLPPSVRVIRDIVYARYGERKLQLDLYLPDRRGDTMDRAITFFRRQLQAPPAKSK